MSDGGWKLISEEASKAHEDSTILTFEEEHEHLGFPQGQI
jgi:hypothetical protein